MPSIMFYTVWVCTPNTNTNTVNIVICWNSRIKKLFNALTAYSIHRIPRYAPKQPKNETMNTTTPHMKSMIDPALNRSLCITDDMQFRSMKNHIPAERMAIDINCKTKNKTPKLACHAQVSLSQARLKDLQYTKQFSE